MPSRDAHEMIRANHYSGRSVNNSYVHLAVLVDGERLGALQFGYAMNPARMSHIVANTGSKDYLELNRMWIDDAAPRNTESQAIAFAIKYIRAVMPRIRFVQSFADERCGGLGCVYQAAGFLYLGSHVTDFYELDGETYHRLLLTAHKKGGPRGDHLRRNIDRARRVSCRQFRYIRFLRPGARRYLRLPVLPYPKPKDLHAAGQSGQPGCPPGQPGSIPGGRSNPSREA